MTSTRVVDGVPVEWTEQPGRFTASLLFRVGVRDESFETAGITHLVEHLAFSAIPIRDHDTNGEVMLGLTEFTFGGAASDVTQSLTEVCESLAALAAGNIDPGMLERERAILEAEGETSAVPPEVAEALSNHYGLVGPGLASAGEQFLGRLTVSDISLHARTFFNRSNAVLVCSGAPPEGLRLPLPEGQLQPLHPSAPIATACPAEYGSAGPRPVISFRIPGGDSDAAAAVPLLHFTLERRIHELLRRRDGLVYGCDCSTVNVDENSALFVVALDVAPRNAAEAIRRTVDELRSIRDGGPTADEVRRSIERLSADAAEPGSDHDDAYDSTVARLLGQREWNYGDYMAALDVFTPALTSDLLHELEDSLLVGLPEEAIPDDVDATSGVVFPARRPQNRIQVQGKTYKRGLIARFAGAPADVRLIVGDRGLELTLLGETTAVPWEDIVGMEREPMDEDIEGITLFTREAFQLGFLSAWFRRGDEAARAIRSAVPERLQYMASPEGADA